MSPLTTRSERIKYLLTQMYELLQNPSEKRITFLHLHMSCELCRNGQYFHLTPVNYDDENMTLFTRINMCDTLCDNTSMASQVSPSCCCRGCCCWCCQVLLLQHKRGCIGQSEALFSVCWPMRGPGSVTWVVTRPSRPLTSPAEPGQDPTWRGDSAVSLFYIITKNIPVA